MELYMMMYGGMNVISCRYKKVMRQLDQIPNLDRRQVRSKVFFLPLISCN